MAFEPSGRRSWIFVALLCAAMLLAPLAAFLFVPVPKGFAVPKSDSSRSSPAAQNIKPAEPESPRPRPTTARTAGTKDAKAAGSASFSSVSGTVLDPDGRPVARAVVNCDEKNLTTTTSEDGSFTLGPEAADCNAFAIHPGFNASERTMLRGGDGNVLRLLRGGAISGVVVDESGSPVKNFLLAIESFSPKGESGPSPGMGRSQQVADPSGQFTLGRLSPGRYVLTVSGEGRPPTRSDGIDVEAGSTTSNVRITLARGASLSGTVLDAESRKPVEGARVALDAITTTGANAIKEAVSDANGAYTLEGVPPGPFSIRIVKDGFRSKIVSGITTRGASSIREDVQLSPRGDGSAGNSEFGGVGAVLSASASGGVLVASVVPGGPAETAGLARGDRLLRIDGTDVSNKTMSDCVQLLRGAEGSRVTVAVERDGTVLERSLVRATIVQ